jgi:hypothetical protein
MKASAKACVAACQPGQRLELSRDQGFRPDIHQMRSMQFVDGAGIDFSLNHELALAGYRHNVKIGSFERLRSAHSANPARGIMPHMHFFIRHKVSPV